MLYEVITDHYFEEKVHDKLEKESSPEVILDFFDYYAHYCERTGVRTMTQMMSADNKNFIKEGRYMRNNFV